MDGGVTVRIRALVGPTLKTTMARDNSVPLLDDSYWIPQPAARSRWWWATAAVSAAVGLSLLGGLWQGGLPLSQKVAVALVKPLGLIWLALLATSCFAMVHRWWSIAGPLSLLTLGLWLAGNGWLADRAIAHLEGLVTAEPLEGNLRWDVLVVLGGGTSSAPSGRAQVADSGDRVLLAAQLFLAGRADRLVTTGSSFPGLSGALDGPAEQTIAIWRSLGVPAGSIERLEGINTSQELQQLRRRPELWQGKRVGLVTSAWHLPRALRLAERNELDLLPVAADVRRRPSQQQSLWWVPQADAVLIHERVLNEWLGMAVGR
jgi:uncharacterized SAM-binding protein YcdF (DUF218 family)